MLFLLFLVIIYGLRVCNKHNYILFYRTLTTAYGVDDVYKD